MAKIKKTGKHCSRRDRPWEVVVPKATQSPNITWEENQQEMHNSAVSQNVVQSTLYHVGKWDKTPVRRVSQGNTEFMSSVQHCDAQLGGEIRRNRGENGFNCPDEHSLLWESRDLPHWKLCWWYFHCPGGLERRAKDGIQASKITDLLCLRFTWECPSKNRSGMMPEWTQNDGRHSNKDLGDPTIPLTRRNQITCLNRYP